MSTMPENDDDGTIASWECSGGEIIYDLRVQPDGCMFVAVFEGEDEEAEQELVVAAGLEEINEAIKALTEARAKILALPVGQQGAPVYIETEEGAEEEEEEEEEP